MPPISVCIIAKNEEENIGRCLESLVPYRFEVIVVDTGSSDRTKEIAAEYGAKLHDFEWIADFAAARNFAAGKASNNWVLALDCDEYITHIKTPELFSLIRQYPRYVGTLEIENEMLGPSDAPPDAKKRTYTTELVRLYPRKYYHFEGAIHEQVQPILARHKKDMYSFPIPLKLYHTGYVGTAEQIAAKNKRNIDMLLKAVEENPDDAYNYFQIGQSYILGDEHEEACKWFNKGLSYDLDPSLEYVQTMVVSYGQSLLNIGRNEEALSFMGIYDAFCQQTDFVYLMGRIYEANGQYMMALGEFLKAITMGPGKQNGINTFMPCYQIAVIYDNMAYQQEKATGAPDAQNMEIARMYYQKCGDFPPARRRLEELGRGNDA